VAERGERQNERAPDAWLDRRRLLAEALLMARTVARTVEAFADRLNALPVSDLCLLLAALFDKGDYAMAEAVLELISNKVTLAQLTRGIR